MRSRTRWAAVAGFGTLAAGAALAVASGTGLASELDTPGVAAVPSVGPGYLDAPAAQRDGRPTVVEQPGPSSLDCFRWPDGSLTQTFDPLSPTCVAGWDFTAGNGGSTAPGVADNVVKVGVARSSPELEGLVSWFNATYQFYGRSISLVEVGSFGTPAQQRARWPPQPTSGSSP